MSELRLIRKANLKRICDKRGINGAQLARMVEAVGGPKSGSYWADMLNQSNQKSFGEDPARAAERALSLATYALDAPDADAAAPPSPPPNSALDGRPPSPQSGPTTVNEPLVTYNIDAEQYMTEQDLMKLVRMVRPEDRKKAAAAIGPLLAGYRAELDSLLGQIDAEPESNRPFLRPRSGGG